MSLCRACGTSTEGTRGYRLCGRCYLQHIAGLPKPPPRPPPPPKAEVEVVEVEDADEEAYIIERKGGLIYRRWLHPPGPAEPPPPPPYFDERPRGRKAERRPAACGWCRRPFGAAPQQVYCRGRCRLRAHRQRVAQEWREFMLRAVALSKRNLTDLNRGVVDDRLLQELEAEARTLHPRSLRERVLASLRRLREEGIGPAEGDLWRQGALLGRRRG